MAWNLTGDSFAAKPHGRQSRNTDVQQDSRLFDPDADNWADQGTGVDAKPSMAEEPSALSVTEALALAESSLKKLVLTVEGEVSELKDPNAFKAVFFSIASDDGQSVMSCMMWRGQYESNGVELKLGARVRVKGQFGVYPKKGLMQFKVREFSLVGEGDLRQKVAALARCLSLEGLTSDERKRPIPRFCQRVAVVTSPHGKAIHDVIRTLRRRNPLVELLVFGVTVEGKDAPRQMIEALKLAGQHAPDAILLVRGGGSYEDLMPFNDEGLARSVAASPVPVVTGIGHEPDTTICDLVADRRRSTPTAAAESVAPAVQELADSLNKSTARLASLMTGQLSRRRERLESVASRPVLVDPRTALVTYRAEQLAMATDRLERAIPAMVSQRAHFCRMLGDRLQDLGPLLVRGYDKQLVAQASSLRSAGTQLLDPTRRDLAAFAGKLEALSPLAVIARGYAIATDDTGAVVSTVSAVSEGDNLDVRVQDGTIHCRVAATQLAAERE